MSRNLLQESRAKSQESHKRQTINPLGIHGRTPVATHGHLRVRGNQIISAIHGHPVQLRGVSLFWSIAIDPAADFWTAAGIEFLVKNFPGLSLVRLAMGVDEEWGDRGYLHQEAKEWAKIVDCVDKAIELGIYVIVDWHSHRAENEREEAKAFFQRVVRKYGGVANVILENFNEPVDQGWSEVIRPYHAEVGGVLLRKTTQ